MNSNAVPCIFFPSDSKMPLSPQRLREHFDCNMLDSGVDATVWRGRAGTQYVGKVYVSMRGAEAIGDAIVDWNLLSGKGSVFSNHLYDELVAADHYTQRPEGTSDQAVED